MNTALARSLLICCWLVLCAGCASGPTPVDCDGRLKPINAPAPKAAPRRAGIESPRETAPATVPPQP